MYVDITPNIYEVAGPWNVLNHRSEISGLYTFLGNKKSEEIGSGKTTEAKSYIQVVLSGHWHY